MKSAVITAVGVDVSKSKSTVAVRRPGGEIVMHSFDVRHTNNDLKKTGLNSQKVRRRYSGRNGTYQYVLEADCLDPQKGGLLCLCCKCDADP